MQTQDHPERRYYAHTAETPEGQRLPETSGLWQPLGDHLRNVSDLAARFAAPMGPAAEAEKKAAASVAAAAIGTYLLNPTTCFNPCRYLAIDHAISVM